MKNEKSIGIAFFLNLFFSLFEVFGGLLTGSVAILSDALHDMGDAASIGIAALLERKSRRAPDDTHTYGYARYTALGSAMTYLLLTIGSVVLLFNALPRVFSPTPVHDNGMIGLALVGLFVNLLAAILTHGEGSLGRRAVWLHMIEDVLGWAAVLIGAAVIKLTGLTVIDPLLSIALSLLILPNALSGLSRVLDLFLDKTPHGVALKDLREAILALDCIQDVHHMHVRSLDGYRHDATLHIVHTGDPVAVKAAVRQALLPFGICHVTVEAEAAGEPCAATACHVEATPHPHAHGHSHGHAHRGHHHSHSHGQHRE